MDECTASSRILWKWNFASHITPWIGMFCLRSPWCFIDTGFPAIEFAIVSESPFSANQTVRWTRCALVHTRISNAINLFRSQRAFRRVPPILGRAKNVNSLGAHKKCVFLFYAHTSGTDSIRLNFMNRPRCWALAWKKKNTKFPVYCGVCATSTRSICITHIIGILFSEATIGARRLMFPCASISAIRLNETICFSLLKIIPHIDGFWLFKAFGRDSIKTYKSKTTKNLIVNTVAWRIYFNEISESCSRSRSKRKKQKADTVCHYHCGRWINK